MQQVVGAILRRDGRILLGHRHPDRVRFPDLWDVPGGRVEPGEPHAEALCRELREELGIEADAAALTPWRTVAGEGYELTLFLVDHWTGRVVNADPSEHDRLGWVTLEELPALALAEVAYRELLPEAMRE